LARAVGFVEGLEVRRIREIVSRATNFFVRGDECFPLHRDARFDAGKKCGGRFCRFDLRRIRPAAAVEQLEDIAEGIADGGAMAARGALGRREEFEFELFAVAIDGADVVDEVEDFFAGAIRVGVEDELGLAVGKLKAGGGLFLAD
jgi:hypothetical protein